MITPTPLGLLRSLIAVSAIPFLLSCGAESTQRTDVPTPTASAAQVGPPTVEELQNATYVGIYDEPVQLVDGRSEGEPFVGGGASRPSAGLAPDFRLTHDLDGDGVDEAVVLLWASSGGSGTYNHVAVVGRRDGAVVNLGTAELGDRVQVRAAQVVDGAVVLDVVQAGPEDAACCPSQTATRTFALGADGLTEIATQVTGTLSLATLEGVEWVLAMFDHADPAPTEPEITLVFSDGRIAGRSGCNRYFAGVVHGDLPGDFTVGQIGATKMACAEEVMRLEQHYLANLAGATKFTFVNGRLVVTCRVGDEIHSMTFVARALATGTARE